MNTKDLSKDYFEFYEKFKNKFESELNHLNIGIIDDFIDNKINIENFYKNYITKNQPKTFLVGINPGKNGAGKTGIPFIDYNSLSKIIKNVDKNESEKSSKFIFEIIEHFGIDKFYKHIHLTNICPLGFYDLKTKRNINYNTLPTHIAQYLLENFIEEVEIFKPDTIIPISDIVDWELRLNLLKKGKLNAKIENRLYHPASKFAKKNDYISILEKYISK